ncbi:uncharacterized protein LOC111353874 [Spodoptera litura]|uniref:Uncharacterized protein LOC111353874 n=1 Tax=Spodoptera litura TaxID=69820 RepID=A0A9J7E207_SPOLT|nr:uncharacterized protein LOC111353874 [Spodoptera litura]
MANFDTIKLIEEVKRRNVLWLSKDRRLHGETDTRIKAWEEIAAILYHNWNTCSEVQRVQRLELLKKKWRNVRDYYKKEKKRLEYQSTTSGKGREREKRLNNYFDQMTFLDDGLERHDSNNPEELFDDRYEDSNNSTEDTLPIRPVKQEEKDPIPTTNEMPSFVTEILTTPNCQDDSKLTANRNFLLSLLPDMTSLDERNNMIFRMGALRLMSDIKFGSD